MARADETKNAPEGDEARVLSEAAKRALAEAAARREAAAAALPPPREHKGRGGLDPVRYADWEVKGLATDF